MATYLADRVIVFEGKPAVSATATPCVTVTHSSDIPGLSDHPSAGRNPFCLE